MLPFTEYKNRNPNGGFNCKSIEVPDVVGKDGEKRTFKFYIFELIQRDTSSGEFESYEFRATDLYKVEGEYISIVVTNFSGVYQVTNITSGGSQLREKGIPEILIAYASQYLTSSIESSSNLKNHHRYFGEQRYPDGEKVWLRLKNLAENQVSYDQSVDRYTFQFIS